MHRHDRSPADHQEREPSRSLHFLEHHVGRDHKDSVGEEEDGQGDVEVRAGHVEVFGHAGDFGVADCARRTLVTINDLDRHYLLLDRSRKENK